MTKKQKKEQDKKQRVWFDMPLGTITHTTNKDYDRKKSKKDLKKMLDKQDY